MENNLFDIEIESDLPSIREKIKNKTTQKPKKKKGGYRPVLVDEETLKKESLDLEPTMMLLREKHKLSSMSPQDLVSLYMISYLNQRYSTKFLENFSPIHTSVESYQPISASYKDFISLINFEAKLEKYKSKSLYDIINSFNLHSVPHSARTALAKWYTNEFDLVLMFDAIPTSYKVLEMQAEGKRCVSLISNNLESLVMNERDAFSFLLHDLVHAYKMFSNQILLNGQIGFCRAIMKILDNQQGEELINDLIRSDETFEEKFNYLISDMNSHTKHLFYYFKAILINAFKVKYKLKDEILNGKSLEEFQTTFDIFLNIWEMNEMEKSIARKMLMPLHVNHNDFDFNEKINSKGFNVIDFSLLDSYFMNLSLQ